MVRSSICDNIAVGEEEVCGITDREALSYKCAERSCGPTQGGKGYANIKQAKVM